MKAIIIALGLSIFPSLAHAQITSQQANIELSTLDFYAEGRGMHLSPGILNKLEFIRNIIGGSSADERVLGTLAHRWGIQEQGEELVGIKTVVDQKLNVGVLGCVACHSGKAAGQYIIGIGNKNIDPGQIGMDGVKIETDFKRCL